jgi:hypothetical protein
MSAFVRFCPKVSALPRRLAKRTHRAERMPFGRFGGGMVRIKAAGRTRKRTGVLRRPGLTGARYQMSENVTFSQIESGPQITQSLTQRRPGTENGERKITLERCVPPSIVHLRLAPTPAHACSPAFRDVPQCSKVFQKRRNCGTKPPSGKDEDRRMKDEERHSPHLAALLATRFRSSRSPGISRRATARNVRFCPLLSANVRVGWADLSERTHRAEATKKGGKRTGVRRDGCLWRGPAGTGAPRAEYITQPQSARSVVPVARTTGSGPGPGLRSPVPAVWTRCREGTVPRRCSSRPSAQARAGASSRSG